MPRISKLQSICLPKFRPIAHPALITAPVKIRIPEPDPRTEFVVPILTSLSSKTKLLSFMHVSSVLLQICIRGGGQQGQSLISRKARRRRQDRERTKTIVPPMLYCGGGIAEPELFWLWEGGLGGTAEPQTNPFSTLAVRGCRQSGYSGSDAADDRLRGFGASGVQSKGSLRSQ